MRVLKDGDSYKPMDSMSFESFGKLGQLKIVGKLNPDPIGGQYVAECTECKKDSELFLRGLFVTTLPKIRSGRLPCGCNEVRTWEQWQYLVIIKRRCEELGVQLLEDSIPKESIKYTTKLKFICRIHGEFVKSVQHLLLSQGCKVCANNKPDDEMIKSFFEKADWHPDTKFTRLPMKTSHTKGGNQARVWWSYVCGECGKYAEDMSDVIQKGKKKCACRSAKQTKGYIFKVKNSEGAVIALKFGITYAINQRLALLKYSNRFSENTFELISYWQFPDSYSCCRAELDCKKVVESILTKEQLPVGWSETCSINDLEKIEEIYRELGAKPLDLPKIRRYSGVKKVKNS